MKKIIAFVLLLSLCLVACISCGEKTVDGIDAAKDYLYAMYKDKSEATPSDYELVGKVVRDGVTYDVEWTSSVSDDVIITKGDNGMVTVQVNAKTPTEIPYVLTATLKDANGKTVSVTFNRKIPAYKELTFAEYIATEDDTSVVVKGVVTGIIAKSKGNSSNGLYLQDADGGYYVYNMPTDPVTDDKLEIGMTIRVTGTKDTYSGTYEIIDAKVEILDSAKTEITPADWTEKFKSADSLKDAALVREQALLVTVKGVEVTGSDASSGYYKFKLGNLESYVRISSSVCPLDKDQQTAFKEGHASHLGWTADVTGVLCIYDGAFYLTPVDGNAFNYISLPAKDNAGMVAFEKENLNLISAATEDTEISLISKGAGYEQVSVTWESDSACAVVKDGKLVITLPEEDTVVKITATLKSGNVTDTKVFEIKVDAAATDLYLAKPVTEPVKDTAYKFALEQVSLGKTLYFSGAMDGKYFATTDKAAKATDVYLEEVEGGYRLYFKDGDKKSYLDIYEYSEGKVGVQLTEAPTAVYTWNAEIGILTAKAAGDDYYLGTYKTYNTISASKTSYITGDNAEKVGVSQFVAKLCTVAAAVISTEPVSSPVMDTPYKFYLIQANLEKTLYFSGKMDGKYFATTDKAEKAADVYFEEAEGGYRIYFKDGDKKVYLEIYEYADGKVGVQLTETPTTFYQWNTELSILTAKVAGDDYYLGTYKTYNTISASKTSYITGDNLKNIGVSQFVLQPVTLTTVEVEAKAAAEPIEKLPYKLSLVQQNLGKRLYFSGAMNGNYLGTTDKLSKAVNSYVEAAEGGYRLYFMEGEKKIYIEIYEYSEGKVGVHLTDAPTTVYTWNKDLGIFTANVAGNDYYLGSYKNYDTVSASKTSYITGDNAGNVGVSQFVLQPVTIEIAH
ncbi:MAG: immunoglobulin-like domain-containing protein [Eubacteriales bacterium]|nr:immunoglobulin-like domain-containing protein [Eubacteriales bacterium]